MAKVKRTDLINFSERNKKVYVYGVGAYGELVYQIVGKKFIKGFIVSDERMTGEKSFFDIPIYKVSDLVLCRDLPIIVALNKNNSEEVSGKLEDFKNVLYIF